MRALRITLRAQKPIVLPLAYNELVQGMLYNTWRERFPTLHDEGAFRPFVFGRLEGRSKIDSQKRTILFYDMIRLEVRTPFEELLDECATQLANAGAARIGAHMLNVINLQANDRLLFPQRAVISLSTPVVAYRTLEDGHTLPYSPLDSEWLELILLNSQRKATELGVVYSSQLQTIPYETTLRKQVTRFKGTYITGWLGKLIVSADPQILAMLWCCGLGVKNSQGFGLFDIVDE